MMFPFVLLAALGGFVWWNATKKRSSAAPAAPPYQPQWPTGPGVPAPPGSEMSKALVTDWAIEICNSGTAGPCIEGIAIDKAIQAAQAGFIVQVEFNMSRVGPSGGTEKRLFGGRLVAATMSPDGRRVSVVAYDSPEKGGEPLPAYLFDNNYASLAISGGPQASAQSKSDSDLQAVTNMFAGVSGNVASLGGTRVGQYTAPEQRVVTGNPYEQYRNDRVKFWR